MRTGGALHVSGMVSPGWPAATGPGLGTAIQPCGEESNVALASASNETADPKVRVVVVVRLEDNKNKDDCGRKASHCSHS